MRGLSLLGIGAIWLQTLVCLLMRIVLYWLPKFHKRSYNIHFIENSSSCITTQLSVNLTFCLIEIKNLVIKYCETILRRMVKIYFGILESLLEIHR